MRGVYYNEIDPYAAQWLRNLIEAGHLPDGDVDERSIVDVQADDLKGYVQCHFFAGIGGWPYALRLAEWPDDRPIWTGSCPCQPFSSAGRQQGTADKRHLWPEFLRLIAEWDVPTVVGEQVASRLGRDWLAGIRVDLEALGYAVGAADISAASVGAPHIRQRLYWVADTNIGAGGQRCSQPSGRHHRSDAVEGAGSGGSSMSGGLADRLGDTDDTRSQGQLERRNSADQWSAWSSGVAIPCSDGKQRRIESGSFPLAHGVSNRVGRLRGYGNAIVPQVGATFIRAFLDIQAHQRA